MSSTPRLRNSRTEGTAGHSSYLTPYATPPREIILALTPWDGIFLYLHFRVWISPFNTVRGIHTTVVVGCSYLVLYNIPSCECTMSSLPFHSRWACGSFWLETSVHLTTGTMLVRLLGMTCTDPPSGIAGSQERCLFSQCCQTLFQSRGANHLPDFDEENYSIFRSDLSFKAE